MGGWVAFGRPMSYQGFGMCIKNIVQARLYTARAGAAYISARK